jgi:hypothetical protein
MMLVGGHCYCWYFEIGLFVGGVYDGAGAVSCTPTQAPCANGENPTSFTWF